MLRFSVLFLLCLAAGRSVADTGPAATALYPLQGLTAGGYDHFSGQLSPNGEEIYFAGNANSTVEIFAQNLVRGFPRQLLDDVAEVSQPRVSPDGAELLYISYQQDAGGDACIFHMRKRARRCLTKPGTAVLHVFWFGDGESVGVLTREGYDSTHKLLRLPASGSKPGEVLVQRNMLAPAVSPDGRWLAYVPLDGSSEAGGEEAGDGTRVLAARGILLHPLYWEGEPHHFVPDLPGSSNFPSFSIDGKHLYFTQYLNDNNFDGVIDGNDNGVLFRLRFHSESERPVQSERVVQLTTGRANCQYPAPATDRLLATCDRAGVLQTYAMPLAGQVPDGWGPARIEAEIDASRDPWEQLLLLRRRISQEESRENLVALYRRVVMHHKALKEYESAEYYLGPLQRLSEDDPRLDGWIVVQREILGHRREEQRLGHGKLSREFIHAQRARLERLEVLFAAEDPSIQRLARLAESEIYLILGDKAASLAMFDAVKVAGETDPSVLQIWAQQGEALFRDLGDRKRWMDVHRVLAEHPALDERDRLYHAAAFVKVLSRGLSPEKEFPAVQAAREDVADGTEVALMLDLERALLRVEVTGEEAAEAELKRLWASAPTFDRHRTVAMTTIERAERKDWGRLLHTFGRQWLDDVPEGHPERKYAEGLYAEVMLERAYVELKHGRVADAKELFLEITRATPSLEAHVGFIEAALTLGVAPADLIAEYQERFPPTDPVEPFAEAYIVARGLSEIRDVARHAEEVERARRLLRPVAMELPHSAEVHHLYAYLAHRSFYRTGEKDASMAAHTRYHLALDLVPHDPRRRANLLSELGLLQASLGNHRIPLRYFEERERLPFLDVETELSFRLAKARSLFHSSAYLDAKAEMAIATAVIEREPEYSRYLPLVLDRAALYHYAVGANERAVELYTRLVDVTHDNALAVRVKARLGLGASALAAGQIELALATLEEARALLDSDEPFRRTSKLTKVESHFDRYDYRHLVAGLLAETRRAEGDLAGVALALEQRRDLFRERHEELEHGVLLFELARVSYQLAETAYRRGDARAARAYLEEGLEYVDTWRQRAKAEVDEVTVAIVRAAAELHLYGGEPLSAFSFNVIRRLRKTHEAITARTDPRWSNERHLFPTYLTLLETAQQ